MFTLFLFFLLYSCGNNQKNQTDLIRQRRKERREFQNDSINNKNAQVDKELLLKIIESENNHCPQDAGIGITIKGINLVDSEMIINCLYDNNVFQKTLSGSLKDDIKQCIIFSLCKNDDDIKKMKLLKRTHTSLVYLFQTNNNRNNIKLVISPNELPEAIPSLDEIENSTRNLFVNRLNMDLPQTINRGMIQKAVKNEGDDIVLYIECDENILNMDNLISLKDDNKAAILHAMKHDDEGNILLNTINSLNCCLVYRYYGNKSNKTADIRFTKSDIQ